MVVEVEMRYVRTPYYDEWKVPSSNYPYIVRKTYRRVGR
jgi:hypothetical protein